MGREGRRRREWGGSERGQRKEQDGADEVLCESPGEGEGGRRVRVYVWGREGMDRDEGEYEGKAEEDGIEERGEKGDGQCKEGGRVSQVVGMQWGEGECIGGRG
jgi:hypothetical protein